MNKSELAELARLGVRTRLRVFERQLLALYREFPEEFIGGAAPVLVSPDLKDQGNDWPAFTAKTPDTNGNGNGKGHPVDKTAKIRAAWTPERRAKQSRMMKRRLAMAAATKKTPPKPKTPKEPTPATPWGTFVWQRMHDFLATQDGHRAKMADIMKAIDAKTQPTVISSVKMHGDLFKRVAMGEYQLKKILSADQKGA